MCDAMNTMKKVLIVSGHPDLAASLANATILAEVEKLLPEAEIRRLDSLYPDYRFNIASEQQALLAADIIVWQFPFSWYSVPGLMKLWLDQVFLHGFSHGAQKQLSGKKLLLSFTAGAPPALYTRGGAFGHAVEDYLMPFVTLAFLCGLDLQPPVYSTGLSYATRGDAAAIEKQRAAAQAHAAQLIAAIRQLAD